MQSPRGAPPALSRRLPWGARGLLQALLLALGAQPPTRPSQHSAAPSGLQGQAVGEACPGGLASAHHPRGGACKRQRPDRRAGAGGTLSSQPAAGTRDWTSRRPSARAGIACRTSRSSGDGEVRGPQEHRPGQPGVAVSGELACVLEEGGENPRTRREASGPGLWTP